MKKIKYVFLALGAALLYSLNSPFAKLLLDDIDATLLAGLLYLGAGIGVGALFLIKRKHIDRNDLLSKSDTPYVISMIGLDIIAPILLMWGLKYTAAQNAALLNNFEIVATSLIALFIFKEKISPQLWIGIIIIFISCVLLSFDNINDFSFSYGSILILLAAICWGFENNCTKKISNKSSYQIVMIKGLCCGTSSILLGLVFNSQIINVKTIFLALILGFFAYGLSILFYVQAQKGLGAAKTSAYYSFAPFFSVFLSFIIFKNPIADTFFIALLLMVIGSIFVFFDTLKQ